MKRFSIYDRNMLKFEKALKRIKNKCEKYNCPFIYNEVGEEFKTELVSELDDGTPLDYDAWDEEYLEEIEAINDILNIK